MTYFDIALRNITRKFSSYFIYLISAIFAVTVFSIFCSMYFNPQFSEYRFGSGKMAILFKISAVAVLLFSSVFIFYANNFFVKTRKKEIAVYSLLGMRKGQIGLMLFFENSIIGLIAIAGGIAAGTLLSRFFCMLMLTLMKQIPRVTSDLHPEPVAITMISFFIIFTLNSLNAYTIIYRFRLIELLSANKEGEKMPAFSILGGILSIMVIAAGYAYGLSLNFNRGGMKQLPAASLVILLVVAGTILLFKNFIPMITVKLKENRKIYYRPSNLISLSQIVYRINANSLMLSIIAILSAVTVTMISATFVLYSTFTKAGSSYASFSYLSHDVNDSQYQTVINQIKQTGEVKLLSSTRFTMIKAAGQCARYARDLSYDAAPGTTPVKVNPGDPFDLYVLSSADYKTIIQNLHVGKGEFNNQKTDFPGTLKDNECFFLDGNMNTDYCRNLTGQQVSLKISGKSEQFTIAGVSMHKYLGVFKNIRKTTLVLNDRVYAALLKNEAAGNTVSFMGLMFDHPSASRKTVAALNQIIPADNDVQKVLHVKNLNYYEMNNMIYVQYGAYLFIGTFLGILFLLASGSIMYYKQIIEAEEETGRYDILRKTGMNRKEARRSISRQLAAVFGIPLLIGLLHSVFAMIIYNRLMMFVAEEISWAYLQEACVCVIFIIIYFFYYRLSVNSYMKIVWKNSL